MSFRLYLAAALGLGSAYLAGCGSNPCDRAEDLSLSEKVGACQVTVTQPALGGSCQGGLSSCSEAEQKTLDGIVTCLEDLAVCAEGGEEDWQAQHAACYASAQGLSEGCRTALFGEEELPGTDQDAGVDAGVFDAGVQPDTTDAGVLDVFVTADETRIALAWTQSQPGTPAYWDVIGFTAADVREPAVRVDADLYFTQEVGVGVKKRFFVVGVDSTGAVLMTEVDAGTPEETDAGTADDAGTGTSDAGTIDAGMPGTCSAPLDCPANRVCDLGKCRILACTPGQSGVCPVGYDCTVQRICERTVVFDGGTIDAGVTDAGVAVEGARPFTSELQEISTSTPVFSTDRVTSVFPAASPDLAAFDTARQFMIMEQEGQIFGYQTSNRGASWRTVPVDQLGQRPRVAYEPTTRTLYACYNALGGIRVRWSHDFGATWVPSAVDLLSGAPDDGGTPELISDCDIAPWRDGSAMVVAVSGNDVKSWVVNSSGAVAGPDSVYIGNSTTGNAPESVAIATLPSDSMVHVVFTITRLRPGGGNDTEVVGMYRDASSGGAFEGPKPLHNSPNPNFQFDPAVAIDPVSKRAIAAFGWREVQPARETIYVTMWMPAVKGWATGDDLDIFVLNPQKSASLVMTDRPVSETWTARAASVAVAPNGKIILAFAAGPVIGSNPVLKPYAVGFDLDITNPVLGGAVKGWYLPPAVRMSETTVYRAQTGVITGPIIATDQQISTYFGFIEGAGNAGDTPNRPVVISRPK